MMDGLWNQVKKMSTINLKELIKKDVVTSDGHIIGKIDGAIITNKGNISSLSVKLEKDVVSGLKTKPNLRQDMEIKIIAGITDRVLLNQPLSGLSDHLIRHNEHLNADRLIGMEVTDTKGTNIGTVDDIMIEQNQDTWRLPAIRVKVNSDEKDALKMKSIKLAGNEIDISTGIVRDVGGMVMLNITADHLNNILEAPPLRKN